MKQKLFTFLCLCVLCIGSAWGETATFGEDWNSLFGTSYSGSISSVKANSIDFKGTANNVSIEVQNGSSTNGYVKTSDFRAYNGYSITLTAPEGNVITAISSTAGGKTFTSGVTANCGTISIKSSAISWSGSSRTVVLSIGGTVSFKTITVTYSKETTDPVIISSDVTIESDATSGEIEYSITNPVSGKTLSATTEATWISNINVSVDKVTFAATANTGAERSADVTLSYEGAESKVVKVTQKVYVPTFASLAALVAAGEPTAEGQDVKVTLTNDVITKISSSSVCFDVDGQEVQIYKSSVPASWRVKGKVSGTITCQWLLYGTDTWELKISDWSLLTYVDPDPEPMQVAQTATLSEFSSFSGSGYKTVSDYAISGYYGFGVTDCMIGSDKLQMKASTGTLVSPVVKSSNGYVVKVEYTSDTPMTLKIGSEDAVTGVSGVVMATTNSTSSSFTLKVGSKYALVSKITIYPIIGVTLNASNGGNYATFYADFDAAIPANVEAYGAKLNDTQDAIVLTPVTDGALKANSGYVLKSSTETSCKMVVATDAATSVETSLSGVLEDTPVSSLGTIYVLNKYNDKVGFYGYSGTTLGANKAYLTSSNMVNGFEFVYGDATVINAISNTQVSGARYNLNGQSVSNDYKGIVIVNGKKFLNK